MSHRIVVMSEGRVTGTLDAGEATQESVMHFATLRPDENPEDAAELGLVEAVMTTSAVEQPTRRRGRRHRPQGPAAAVPRVREPDRDLPLLLDRQLELPELLERHGDPLLDRGDRAAGARDDVRDHHRRHRPLDRHRDDAVRGHLRRADHQHRRCRCSLGVIGAVLFGGLIGLVNGFNVSILGIPPFIATLAMMLVGPGPGARHIRQRADLLHRLAELHQHLDRPPVRGRTSRTPCSSWRWPR